MSEQNKNKDDFHIGNDFTEVGSSSHSNQEVENDAAAAARAAAEAASNEPDYTPDPDFDLDRDLAEREQKRDRYHNEFGFDTGTLDLDSLSDTDREILYETHPIHIDRDDIPAETQAMHVLTLEREKREKHHKVYRMIVILMVIGISVSLLGIFINQHMKSRRAAIANATPSASSDAAAPDEEDVTIDASVFPDDTFREWVSSQADTNSDGLLSPDERNAVIILNVSGDTRYTDITGIAEFPLLQAINISGTSITAVDFSNNSKLKNLDVSNTGMTVLDLSKNQELTSVNLANTQITELTLPENSKITTLTYDGTVLACEKNSEGNYTGCAVDPSLVTPTPDETVTEEAPAEEQPAEEQPVEG